RGVKVLSVDLVVIDGPSRGQRVRVESGAARIGSAAGNKLVLADKSVSRAHCEIEVHADRVTVRDLGSTNGTFIGDVRVRDADVSVGSVVRCAGSAFRIEAGDEPAYVAI